MDALQCIHVTKDYLEFIETETYMIYPLKISLRMMIPYIFGLWENVLIYEENPIFIIRIFSLSKLIHS